MILYEFTESERLQKLSNEYILGGVNSPSRSYKAVGGGAPVVMREGHGAYLYDVDGNKYIDYLQAYGPIITGHAHPHITEAIQDQRLKVCYMVHRLNLKLILVKITSSYSFIRKNSFC